tara:strand:- start:511 stop:765 length:255 start_codon:yes stop_codon:yes gene_type:complete
MKHRYDGDSKMSKDKDIIIRRDTRSNRLRLDEQVQELFDALMDRYEKRKFKVKVPGRDKKMSPVELTPEMLMAMVEEVMEEQDR